MAYVLKLQTLGTAAKAECYSHVTSFYGCGC
jgi:hypothetical protein